VQDYRVGVAEGRSPSGNLDLGAFEDPNENFVQLVNSVPPHSPFLDNLPRPAASFWGFSDRGEDSVKYCERLLWKFLNEQLL
jgi:hypothetical protein